MAIEFFHAWGDRVMPIDSSKLLEELCGQPELITRLLHVFQAETQKDIDSLEAALAAHDSCKVATLAHRLKGSAATIGAEPLRMEAAQIEGLGRQGKLQQAQEHMSDLRHEFERFCGFMSELRNWE